MFLTEAGGELLTEAAGTVLTEDAGGGGALPPAPPVPQVPAGWKPVPADFDLWVTGSFGFLAQAPCLRVQLAGGQSLTGGAFNTIHYDTVLEDPYGGWSSVVTGSQPAFSWLCPAGCGGWYEVSMTGFTGNQGSTAAQAATALTLNGSLWQYGSDDWAVSGGNTGSSGAVQVPLLPGDYVTGLVFLTNSVAVPTTAGQIPTMELTWVSS